MTSVVHHFWTFAFFCTAAVPTVRAIPFVFETTESSQYLIVGTQVGGKATDANTSNFELGAIKAPVPSTDSFLNNPADGLPADEFSGSTGGPTLNSSQPAIPDNAKPVGQGIGFGGNIAVIDPESDFAVSDVGVYGDLDVGIRIAGGVANNKASNGFFNDPNHYPNTFNEGTQSGLKVEANGTPGPDKIVADQTTRIDAPTSAGVTYNYDHSALVSELDAAGTAINGLTPTTVLDVSGGNAGEFDLFTTVSGSGLLDVAANGNGGVDATLTLGSGLQVIDIFTSLVQKDFLLNDSNFIIDGLIDTIAIFRLPDDNASWGANMLVENSNILIGNGGIGLDSVLFYTDQMQNDVNFNFNNMIVNGVAFWSLADGTISVNNGQGCTQFIGDQVNLQDVRFDRCAFDGSTPRRPADVPDSFSGLVGVLVLAALMAAHALGRTRRQDT